MWAEFNRTPMRFHLKTTSQQKSNCIVLQANKMVSTPWATFSAWFFWGDQSFSAINPSNASLVSSFASPLSCWRCLQQGGRLCLLLLLLLVSGQSSNSHPSQPTLLSHFTDSGIWPEASTKIHLFWFLPLAVALCYPAGKRLNEALLASRAILEWIRVWWVLVQGLLGIRCVGDG